MALYNEILVGRFNRALQKYFGLKGGPPAPQLSSDIHTAHNFFSGVENRYLESWQRFMFSQAIGPVAAVASELRLRNPAGSNVVAVIEQIWTLTSAADAFTKVFHGPIGTDFATLGILTQARLDPRGQPQPTCIASATAAAYSSIGVSLNIGNQANIPQVVVFDSMHEFPLLPGDAYDFVTNAVNIQAVTGWIWRERFLEEGERF